MGLNVIPKTMKILGKKKKGSTGVNLHDLALGNDFF